MRRIDVAADDHALALLAELGGEGLEVGVKVQLVFEPLGPGSAVGEIHIAEHEAGKLGDDGAAFAVERIVPETFGHLDGFLLGKKGHTGIALSFGGAENPMIALHVLELLLDLAFLGLGFLQAEDVRLFPVQPIHEPFFIDGPEAVHVP